MTTCCIKSEATVVNTANNPLHSLLSRLISRYICIIKTIYSVCDAKFVFLMFWKVNGVVAKQINHFTLLYPFTTNQQPPFTINNIREKTEEFQSRKFFSGNFDNLT